MSDPQLEQTARFVEEVREALSQLDLSALASLVSALAKACAGGRRIFLLGNGGSAALASHFASDLVRVKLDGHCPRAVSLADSSPVMTAIANDQGYDQVFRAQLEGWLEAQDIVLVFSSSGNSENLIRAVELAKDRRAIALGLLGFDGGAIRSLLDHALLVDSRSAKVVESVHNVLAHMMTGLLQSAKSR